MKRVLLTGMSGTGKSSVIRALAARGFKAIDTDDGWCQPLRAKEICKVLGAATESRHVEGMPSKFAS